jgi:hypothetical protein
MTKLVHFDWAIKNLLRNKDNFDILEGFLSELLHTKVTIEALLESESNKKHKDDRSNRVDLLFLTEAQGHDVLQLGENEQKAYGLEKNPSDIFPEYYLIKVNQFNERIKDKFDEWVYFLKTEKIQSTFTAQGIRSAAKKLDIMSLTDEERKSYERYEENTHYEASMHESNYGRGKLEGKLEGDEIATHRIAKNMLECGIDMDIIIKSTGLARKTIDNIKKVY